MARRIQRMLRGVISQHNKMVIQAINPPL